MSTDVVSESFLFFCPSCPEDTIGSRVVICGWKAKVSSRVQISKFDRTHYKVLCGIPPGDKQKGTICSVLLLLARVPLFHC